MPTLIVSAADAVSVFLQPESNGRAAIAGIAKVRKAAAKSFLTLGGLTANWVVSWCGATR